jgi:antitoxin component of RelBE/YafQ-DinJ toxin-antitoxin module
MADEVPVFSRKEIERLLSLLNEELKRMEVTGEICIVGGAAMVLAFGNRASTRDIDALVIAPSSVRAAAAKVAEENGLPANWLNDGAKGFASGMPIEVKELLQFSNLRIVAPPPAYILAMKCIAARVGLDEHDKEDALYLLHLLGLQNSEAVLGVVAQYYKEDRIPAKTRYFVQELCDELH